MRVSISAAWLFVRCSLEVYQQHNATPMKTVSSLPTQTPLPALLLSCHLGITHLVRCCSASLEAQVPVAEEVGAMFSRNKQVESKTNSRALSPRNLCHRRQARRSFPGKLASKHVAALPHHRACPTSSRPCPASNLAARLKQLPSPRRCYVAEVRLDGPFWKYRCTLF